MSTTTTTLHCGTNPLYAHLYSSKNFLSPSFYLPDPIVPLPISSRPTDKELAEFFKRGRGDGRGGRWTKAGSRGGQREEEGEEESMLPAVMINPSQQQEQKQKQHESKEHKVVTVKQNLLPVLRGQDLQDEEVGKASWAHALLSYLSQRSTGHRASPPARLQAFRSALDECEKSVGMDLIKLSWRFSLPRSVAATFAARTHGDDGAYGDDNAERMDEKEMIRAVEEMLERDQGVITMTTLHQCGLSFLLRIALPIASASASAASGNTQLAVEEQLLQHIHRARPSASAPFMKVHSSTSSTDGEPQWLLLEQAADWMRLDEALRSGVLNKQNDLPRLLKDLHDKLHETFTHLTLPPALEKKLLSLQSSARNRRTSSASSSASHTSSEGEEEEEQRRGREAALAIPSATTNATGASEHRSDSAVAGLGFSPRDERKPLSAPHPSSLDADASVATIKGRSELGSRVELAGGRAEMEGGIIRDCLYDARRDRLVLARLPELQLV